MKLIRTFHPIGQGAFYSERFYEDNAQVPSHNIVFDCGTQKGGVNKAKRVVVQAFDSNDTIGRLCTLLCRNHGAKASRDGYEEI